MLRPFSCIVFQSFLLFLFALASASSLPILVEQEEKTNAEAASEEPALILEEVLVPELPQSQGRVGAPVA